MEFDLFPCVWHCLPLWGRGLLPVLHYEEGKNAERMQKKRDGTDIHCYRFEAAFH